MEAGFQRATNGVLRASAGRQQWLFLISIQPHLPQPPEGKEGKDTVTLSSRIVSYLIQIPTGSTQCV